MFIIAIKKKIKMQNEFLTIINLTSLRIIQHMFQDRQYRQNYKIFRDEITRLNKRQLLILQKVLIINDIYYNCIVHERGRSDIVFQLWDMKTYLKSECTLDQEDIERDY